MSQNKIFFKGILFYLMMLSGCAVTTSPFVREMVDLRSIHEGMAPQEVKTLLGDKVVTGYDLTNPKKEITTPIILTNPYREEIFKTGDKIYMVEYYFTSIKKQDGMITNDELTPLVFQNNRLIGHGWEFWGRLKKERPL